MSFKISLAGDLGSGKSTVGAILSERTGATYYATGAIMREVASRHGMDITAFNKYAETHPETDHEIDDGLVRLSDDPRDMIIDSRMAWHFTRGTFRVYMTTEPEISAARIMLAKRETEKFGSIEETAAGILRRRESEKRRYGELYGVDLTDYSNYSLIIDTSYASPEQIADAILASLAAWQRDGAFFACLLSPARILVSSESDEQGEPTVFTEQNRFYLVSGAAALAEKLACGEPFVSCRLTDGAVNGKTYMKWEK